MTRRRLRKLCEASGKIAYRDLDAAIWGGRQVLHAWIDYNSPRGRLHPNLWAYRCRFCPWWHLTKSQQRETAHRITLEDETA